MLNVHLFPPVFPPAREGSGEVKGEGAGGRTGRGEE